MTHRAAIIKRAKPDTSQLLQTRLAAVVSTEALKLFERGLNRRFMIPFDRNRHMLQQANAPW